MAPAQCAAPTISFSKRWNLLGPFRVGTREAVWGANPLEAFGGFQCVPIDHGTNFHSSLGTGGIVQWSTVDVSPTEDCFGHGGRASIELSVVFPEVDWAFQQSVYGWAASQYQAFARGLLTVAGPSSCKVALYTDHILELAVNDKPFFGGDFYAFHRAPLLLNLAAGENKIDLRLVRDVRSMGGLGDTSIAVRLVAQPCAAALNVVEESAVLPDVMSGKLVSPYASVIVCNETEAWVNVLAVKCPEESPNVRLLGSSPVLLAPSQSRPVSLWLSTRWLGSAKGIDIALVYSDTNDRAKRTTAFFKLNLRHRSIQNPHKFTFMHPSGTVSYAILRPPTSKANESAFPILLNLHGAGLEADSYQVRHMLDAVPDLNAWVLFPTGMSPWSGDDWHVWGLADVKAAISAIPDWIRTTNWAGPRADTETWIVTGHSNGGQGSWFLSAHQPDKVVAMAAVSGYSSIQNYVPYVMWKEASPLLNSIIQNSLSSYRHELLLENMTGKPLYQQHGAKDRNVPPYHSRLLSSLCHKSGCSSQYVELPNHSHWFDGAMTTASLQAFYSSVLNAGAPKIRFPEQFEFIVPNSGDVGSRAGIFIDQLQSPDVFGKVSVRRDDRGHVWDITTSNVRRIHLHFQTSEVPPPKTISLDGTLICMPSIPGEVDEVAFVNCDEKWAMCDHCNWKGTSARYGRQRGSLDAILRTPSRFKIRLCSDEAFDEALQISQNLLQYYGADTEIVVSGECSEDTEPGNVISLTVGKAVSPALMNNFSVQIGPGGIEIRRPPPSVPRRIRNQPGLGSAFLRPLPDENLELVLWGSDNVGLRQAVRMVPTLTGAGQPDFIVLGNDARWQGPAGVLAMGFFDHAWQISQASYVP